MLLDLISFDNTLNINLKTLKILGLEGAIYISAILRLLSRQNIQDCLELSRQQMCELTTLNAETQCVIENKLQEIGILKRQESAATALEIVHIQFDVTAYTNLLANGDEKLLTKVTKLAQIKKGEVTTAGKITARQKQALALKYAIRAPNQELLDAYNQWVDGVYTNPRGFLSPLAIEVFQRTIDEYAKGDLDLALKLIEIAAINGYRDATWAINLFEKDYKKTWNLAQIHKPEENPVKRVKVNKEVVF